MAKKAPTRIRTFEDMRLLVEERTAQRDALLTAAKATVRAIASRENTMGDPIDLINAKQELREAAQALREAIAKAEGLQ